MLNPVSNSNAQATVTAKLPLTAQRLLVAGGCIGGGAVLGLAVGSLIFDQASLGATIGAMVGLVATETFPI